MFILKAFTSTSASTNDSLLPEGKDLSSDKHNTTKSNLDADQKENKYEE